MERQTVELNGSELEKKYQAQTASVRCWCVFTTKLVGGLPADEQALDAFAEHHLKIADPEERARTVKRILKEEVGEQETTPETGEIKEKQIYGVNVLRRSAIGPWIGDWMIKANIKQAGSRTGLFVEQRGSKGNFSEAGRVTAIDFSLKEKDHPERIYVLKNDKPAATNFQEFMGSVNSPKGRVSIIHHSECIEEGSRFAFEYRFIPGKVTQANIEDFLAISMNCGLGSVRSMECGKFKIERALIDFPEKKKEDSEPKETKNTKAKGKAA